MPTADEYFFMDEEQQKPLLTQCAQRLAPAIGGQFKWRGDGDELHVTGMFQGRPVRVVLSVSFGSASIELKMPAPVEVENSLFISVDPDAQKGAAESLDRDEWDEDDGTSQKLFLAPTVYMEGDPTELQTMHGMLGRLSAQGQGALLNVLRTFKRGSFSADGQTVKLDCPADVTLDPNVAQHIGYHANMLLLLSNEMAQAWR
jgi:hypothetical protein